MDRRPLGLLMCLLVVAGGCLSGNAPNAESTAASQTALEVMPEHATLGLAPGPTRIVPEAESEALRFFIEHPPPGTLVVRELYEGVGTGGNFMVALAVLDPAPRFFASTRGTATSDYAEIHSQELNVSLRCCAFEGGGGKGDGLAVIPLRDGAPSLEIWLLVTGWSPNEEAWVEMAIEADDGNVYEVPLIERKGDLVVVDLREMMRDKGTHVILDGVTVASTHRSLEITLEPAYVAAASATAYENSLTLALQALGSHHVELAPREVAGGYFGAQSQPFKLHLEVQGDPHSFGGMLLACACEPIAPYEALSGAWGDQAN